MVAPVGPGADELVQLGIIKLALFLIGLEALAAASALMKAHFQAQTHTGPSSVH